ncbi:MAG: DUF393 domain-containing protein [Pseudomonadota bacterium]|nr:DUF393 domain-containing protein [Pseudomonadota bacterium]
MNDITYPLTLYFDGACPLCVADMDNLRLRDSAGRLRFIDASAPGFDAAPAGTTVADLMAAMHARTADGRLLRGVAVFEAAYDAVGLHQVSGWLRSPTWRPLLERLYPFVARHRQHLPRPLVRLLFGRALRRAAEQAAMRRCSADGACRIDPQ